MAINPSLTVSRTAGIAPLAVYCDASGTTATGESFPGQNLFYRFTATGISGNYSYGNLSPKNIMQGAPYAAFCFETAGTYTITLYVTDGTSAVQTSVTITVSDPDTAISSANTLVVAHDGDFTGAPAGDQLTSTDWDAIINDADKFNNGTTYKRLRVKRGGTYTASASWTIDEDGPGLIDAWGSGAKPIISGAFRLQLGVSTNTDMADWRFVDLDHDGVDGTAHGVFCFSGTAGQITFLRCEWDNVLNGIYTEISGLDTTNTPTFTSPLWYEWCICECFIGVAQHSILGSYRRLMVLGTNIVSPSGPAGGHTIRTSVLKHGVFYSNHIEDGSGNDRALITLRGENFDDQGGSETVQGDPNLGDAWTEHIVLSDNRLIPSADSTQAVSFMSINVPTNVARHRYWFFERNWESIGATANILLYADGGEFTIRNNLFDVTDRTGADDKVISVANDYGTGEYDNIDIYNNVVIDRKTSSHGLTIVTRASGATTNAKIKNNIAWGDNNSGTYATHTSSGWGSGLSVSNNSDATQFTQDTSPFVNSAPDIPAEFELVSGSYAIQGGAESVPVYDDYFRNVRNLSDMDIGLHAFTQGSLPGVVRGEKIVSFGGNRVAVRLMS